MAKKKRTPLLVLHIGTLSSTLFAENQFSQIFLQTLCCHKNERILPVTWHTSASLYPMTVCAMIFSNIDLLKANLRGKVSAMCAWTFLAVAVFGIFLMNASQSAKKMEHTLQDYDYAGVREASNEVMRRNKDILKSFLVWLWQELSTLCSICHY